MPDNNYIIPLIKQRMEELGFDKYHMETIRCRETYPGTLNKLQIEGSNQYYYLIEKNIDPSTEIISDTGVLIKSGLALTDEAVSYPNLVYHGIKEFTGQITITATVNFNYEFIRVTPYN